MNSTSTRPRIPQDRSRSAREVDAQVDAFVAEPPPATAQEGPAVFAALLLLAALLLASGSAVAQTAELRTVHGQVIDKNDAPVPSAIVYLKDVRTLTIRTYIAEADGSYHFSGLEPNADYELHAETSELTSSNHAISSFDNRKEIVVPLKVDKEKKKN